MTTSRRVPEKQQRRRFDVVIATLVFGLLQTFSGHAYAQSYGWADLGVTDAQHGVTRVENADGQTEPITVGGLTGRRNVNPAQNAYLYFSVDDAVVFSGNHRDVFITFHYFDSPGISFRVQYDSVDGAYYDGPLITTTGTNTWKAYNLGVKNSYFGNRQNNGADFRVAISDGAQLAIDIVTAKVLSDRFPIVHVAPTQNPPASPVSPTIDPRPLRDACLNPGQWPAAFAEVDWFGNAVQFMNALTQAELTACASNLHAAGKRIVIEGSVLKNHCGSGNCLPGEQDMYDRLANANAFDIFTTDEPLVYGNGTNGPFGVCPLDGECLNLNRGEVVSRTVEWMKQMRQRYPRTMLVAQEAYPRFNADDLMWWIQTVNQAAVEAGTPAFDGFLIDYDWHTRKPEFGTADLNRIAAATHNVGLRFGVLFGAGLLTQDIKTDSVAYDRTIMQGEHFRRPDAGFPPHLPDIFSLNFFLGYPITTIPETQPYTFTNLVRDFVAGSVSGRSSCTYGVLPQSGSAGGQQATSSFTVSAPTGCPWTASTQAAWITITQGSATGDGTVTYTVAANTTGAARSGTIQVQGQLYQVSQAAGVSNQPPTVSISSPAGGAAFPAFSNIEIVASASDPDGSVAKVDFYVDGNPIATDTDSPFNAGWTPTVAGSHALKAKATDNAGGVRESDVVTVTVTSNAPPTVSLTTPSNLARYSAPATVTITATANDSDGTVQRVEFYQGSVKLGTTTAVPYSFTWTNVPAGSYTITARAVDNVGATTTSNAASISVSGPDPRMALDAPVHNSVTGQPFIIGGWAIDLAAPAGTGVDVINVWLYDSLGNPTFIGAPPYGDARDDVAAAYGSQFRNSSFTMSKTGLSPGNYTVVAYAHSTVSNTFSLAKSAAITIPTPNIAAWIDLPTQGQTVSQPFIVTGWTIDQAHPTASGVSFLHIYAYPASGSPIFLGVAPTGGSRPDVANIYGARFATSGWGITASGLAPGTYTIIAYPYSNVTDRFEAGIVRANVIVR